MSDPLSNHRCARPGSASHEPWRCPDCGSLWEPFPQQQADRVEHQAEAQQEDSPPWAEQPMSNGRVAAGVVMGGIVGGALLLQDQQPVLAGVLAAMGLPVLAWWFWRTVRK